MIGFDWPRVIGFDFSGVVVEVARDCDDEFKIGDHGTSWKNPFTRKFDNPTSTLTR